MRPTGMLKRFRLSWMDSTCTVGRPDPDGEPVWDGTAYVVPTMTVYEGDCLLQPVEAETRVAQAGDRPVSLNTYRLTVPADATVAIDDDVTVTGSPDAMAVGLSLRVVDVPKNDLVTVRVLIVEEQT